MHCERWLVHLEPIAKADVYREVEPAVGFEPTTDGLQNRCSTTELSWRPQAEKLHQKTKRPQAVLLAGVRFRVTQSAPPSPFLLLVTCPCR